jgi:hypothetical protein
MKTSYAVFAVVFAVSMLIGIQAVEVVDANPVPWLTTPNLEKPTLTIKTPQNQTTYNLKDIPVNFTVTKPKSWKNYMAIPVVGDINSIDIRLDGNLENDTPFRMKDFTQNQLTQNLILSQVSSGLHTLNITVLSYTFYKGPAFNNTHIISDIRDFSNFSGVSSENTIYQYPIVVSDIVYFTVEQPTQNANNAGSDYLLSQTNLILTAIVIAIVVVASVSLVYLNRRKRKP